MTTRFRRTFVAMDLAVAAIAFVLARVTAIPERLRAPEGWRADVVFVPSGDPENMRTLRAVDIVRAHRAPFLLIAGSGVAGDSSAFLADVATAAGLPKSAILLEEKSTTTFENVAFSRPIIESHGFRRVLLVTNRIHARRAVLTAKTEMPGIDVRVEVVDHDDVPLRDRLRELAKMARYAWLGHVPMASVVGL